MADTTIAHNDWQIRRSVDQTWTVTVLDGTGAAKDITGGICRYLIGPSSVEAAYLDLNSDDDPTAVTITDATAGRFSVRLTTAVTAALPAGSAWHEFLVSDSQGRLQYVAAGRGRIIETLVAD